MWAFCKFNNKHLQPIVDSHLGKGPTTKSDEFLEKFQTVFIFGKLCCNFFIMDMAIPDICHERHEYVRVKFFWPV